MLCCLGTGVLIAPASVPRWVSELRNQTAAHKALEEQRQEKQNPISLFLMEQGGRKPQCWLQSQQLPGISEAAAQTPDMKSKMCSGGIFKAESIHLLTRSLH